MKAEIQMVKSLPIRVIHIVNRMDRGGIETFLMRVYRNIDRDKVQFDFLVHRPGEGVYDEEISQLGGKIYKIEFSYNPLRLGKYRKQLRQFLEAHKEYGTAHSHLNAFNGIVLDTARKCGVRNRIAHIHAKSSGSRIREPIWNIVKMIGRSSFTDRYACSVDAGRWAYGAGGKFSVVKNGIPVSSFAFKEVQRNELRKSFSIKDKFCIGHIGAFRASKNHDFLLNLMVYLKKTSDRQFLLFLVGSGPRFEEVKGRIRELGLESDVFLRGDVPDPENYYSLFDVFCLPSFNEGLGIVAIEAQASGLPCIFSKGVPKEVIVTDLAVQLPLLGNSNFNEWAEQIEAFSNSMASRSTKPSRALEEFDICKTTRKLQSFYLETAVLEDTL